MSNGLQQVLNYMIPAVGTPRGYFWSGVLTGSPVTIDFRNVSGGGIDGQPFQPSGVFIDNSQGTGNLAITVNEISYQMICLEGELLNLQFPAPINLSVSFVGSGQATIVFVDFPVLPYRNLAAGGMSNPMTTLGDIIYGDVGGTPSRLAIGTAGEVLTVTGGVPTWETPTSSSAFADITGDAFDNVNLGGYLQELFDDKLAEPGSTGIVVKTTAGGGVNARTLQGTANKITITNGDGVSADPTFTIPDAVTLVTPTVSNQINLTGGQIKFPATQVPSADANTLDDYEEGTFTPVLTFTTAGNLSVTYSTQSAQYTKIGRQCTITFAIVTSAFTHTTASGDLAITGIPSAIVPAATCEGDLSWSGINKTSYTQITSEITAAATSFRFPASGMGQARSNVAVADCPTGGSMVVRGSITYNV